MMRHLDLFSGIGGFALGLQNAGLSHPVGFVEIDPFCRAVLEKHWPGVPCHDDVTTREFIEGEADVITGGFPCQDVSCAGKRAGLAGARSGLYRELVRAIRVVRPKVAILENVAALLYDGMGTVLGDLAEGGDCVEWDCVPACAIGAPHKRERVFIVTHPDYERLGEEGRIQHRSKQMPSGGVEERPSSSPAPDASIEQMGLAGQPRRHIGVGPIPTDAESLGRGQGRQGRPPDSFARIRDETRRNAADPYGARLAFRESLTRDAWEKLSTIERNAFENERKSLWPDESALSGVDDVIPYWLDRVRATGNAILPMIAELIATSLARKDAAECREPANGNISLGKISS
jgi:DNA (cytosine-5)-methyltransferase 1